MKVRCSPVTLRTLDLLIRPYLRNRSALAVNCCVIIHCLEVSCKDYLEWPSLETRREQSSLNFFYKIHFGTVDLDKDKYLTPAPNLRRTRASHESQYTRYFANSDVLKNSFSAHNLYVPEL